MDQQTFDYVLTIREHHLDTFGHVNNATYLSILEEARWEFVTARGFGLKEIQKKQIGPTILAWEMKFLKELRLRDVITIRSQMLSYEGKIAKMQQQIINEREELCFTAVMTLALFDLQLRKLIQPTPEWLHAIGVDESK